MVRSCNFFPYSPIQRLKFWSTAIWKQPCGKVTGRLCGRQFPQFVRRSLHLRAQWWRVLFTKWTTYMTGVHIINVPRNHPKTNIQTYIIYIYIYTVYTYLCTYIYIYIMIYPDDLLQLRQVTRSCTKVAVATRNMKKLRSKSWNRADVATPIAGWKKPPGRSGKKKNIQLWWLVYMLCVFHGLSSIIHDNLWNIYACHIISP